MFLFRLAGKLGMTVAQLSRQMSYREFIEWGAYLKYQVVQHNINSKQGKREVREVIW